MPPVATTASTGRRHR
uniref:Uncharacterized protein n=1 Tax=Oryza nivara TaxID=4536 RepID=A0A0E0J3A8_ORYNI